MDAACNNVDLMRFAGIAKYRYNNKACAYCQATRDAIGFTGAIDLPQGNAYAQISPADCWPGGNPATQDEVLAFLDHHLVEGLKALIMEARRDKQEDAAWDQEAGERARSRRTSSYPINAPRAFPRDTRAAQIRRDISNR